MDPDELSLISAVLRPGNPPLTPPDPDATYRQGLANALLAYGAGERPSCDPSMLADALRAYGASRAGPGSIADAPQPASGANDPQATPEISWPDPRRLSMSSALGSQSQGDPMAGLEPDTDGGPALSNSVAPSQPSLSPVGADGPVRAQPQVDPDNAPTDATDQSDQQIAEGPDGEILVADAKAHPWVTDFRSRHLAEATKLAQIIGHGATPDEILAVSGNEFDWGLDPKAKEHGNYFGLHSRGTDPSQYFPGQTNYIPTERDGLLATFDPVTGFFYSGLRFASRMKAGAGKADLSNPETFFSIAHSLGWGTNLGDKYLPRVLGAYQTIRRSAAAMEKASQVRRASRT